ncbi:hypothetical protein ACOMHN_030649 [Nucella lapillus]
MVFYDGVYPAGDGKVRLNPTIYWTRRGWTPPSIGPGGVGPRGVDPTIYWTRRGWSPPSIGPGGVGPRGVDPTIYWTRRVDPTIYWTRRGWTRRGGPHHLMDQVFVPWGGADVTACSVFIPPLLP